ncbi:MAG TPA: hypothetical protein VME43_05415 [Bryobacteraceae bacterium]|nr:hypothetical protein [Bryobacteraceae bacterium]
MANLLQPMLNKRKEREAILANLQKAAKAADAVLQSQKQLINTLKAAQGVLKGVQD